MREREKSVNMGELEEAPMNQRYRYKNPPIVEALCEFRFRPGREWDLTIPGKLQTAITGDYTDYTGQPQEQKVIDVALETQQGTKPLKMSYGEGLAKVHLVTNDGKRKVGVGRDVLSIHMLHPYQSSDDIDRSGWNEFRPRITEALRAYWKVAEPRGVTRIGMRYINKIVVPHHWAELAAYINCAPRDVDGLPNVLNKYLSRVEYAYDDKFRLILAHGRGTDPSGQAEILLDIDVISEASDPANEDQAMTMVDRLRAREREVFEALITDKAREHFNAH